MRCSHASAIGPVDEDQRYYLESRGVPPDGRRAAHRARLLRRDHRAPPGAGAAATPLRAAVDAKLDGPTSALMSAPLRL